MTENLFALSVHTAKHRRHWHQWKALWGWWQSDFNLKSTSLSHTYSTEPLLKAFLSLSHTQKAHMDTPLPSTYAYTHQELLWLIVSVQTFQLISSVLRLIKGAVWSYYSVYIFICLPRDLINAAGPQVTGTLITGLHRHHFTPSETDAWAHTLSCSRLSEEWGKVMG